MKRTSYNLPNHAHFLTFSCFHRRQLLTDDNLRLLLLKTWTEARLRGNLSVWSYVIMPEHVHLLIYPKDEPYEMSRILRVLKEGFTRRAIAYWQNHSPQLLSQIGAQRGKRIVHRFWQEGGGFDRNLYNWDTIHKAVEYIEWNPVRRGLVNDPIDWIWSSARVRAGKSDGAGIVDEVSEFF
jgi:putative transposase